MVPWLKKPRQTLQYADASAHGDKNSADSEKSRQFLKGSIMHHHHPLPHILFWQLTRLVDRWITPIPFLTAPILLAGGLKYMKYMRIVYTSTLPDVSVSVSTGFAATAGALNVALVVTCHWALKRYQ